MFPCYFSNGPSSVSALPLEACQWQLTSYLGTESSLGAEMITDRAQITKLIWFFHLIHLQRWAAMYVKWISPLSNKNYFNVYIMDYAFLKIWRTWISALNSCVIKMNINLFLLKFNLHIVAEILNIFAFFKTDLGGR